MKIARMQSCSGAHLLRLYTIAIMVIVDPSSSIHLYCSAASCPGPMDMFVLEPDCEPTALPALDLDKAYHASRRGNNPGDLEGRPPGPGCQSESLRWPHALFESLEKQGRSFFGHSETARSCISQGLLLTTDYSGIGCPEESLKQLVEVSKTVAWNERQGRETGEIWGCQQRAGDLLPYCRRVLLDHTRMFQPQCVRGNMLDRCPRRLLERLERLRVRAAMSLHTRKEMGLRVDASYTLRLGRETVRKAADFMLQGVNAGQVPILLLPAASNIGSPAESFHLFRKVSQACVCT